MGAAFPLLASVPEVIREFFATYGQTNLFRWAVFIAVIIVTWIMARLVVHSLLARLFRVRRVETAVARLLSRLFVLVSLTISIFAFSSILFNANLAALAATLGLISLAVGFGLQNTIANIAGGISLAIDRPFRVGDQIEVGELVGDVQDIGIRSTRIITRRREYVVIPNKFLEERPIVNYTMVFPEIRLDVPLSISYDSDRRLAERILLEVALAHPVVLQKPEPRVVLVSFGDSGVEMQLRCWISHPRSRRIVQSDLLKAIKDRFDVEGVEIPFPYRTIVQKKDMPKPKIEKVKASKAKTPAPRRVLVLAAGPPPARSLVTYETELVRKLGAQMIVVYLATSDGPEDLVASSRALSVYERAADRSSVWYKPIFRATEDLAAEAVSVAREENVDLVIVPPVRYFQGREGPSGRVAEPRLREAGLRRPIHSAPGVGSPGDELVQDLQKAIESYRSAGLEEAPEPIEVSPPEPSTSTVPTPPPESPARAPTETEESPKT